MPARNDHEEQDQIGNPFALLRPSSPRSGTCMDGRLLRNRSLLVERQLAYDANSLDKAK